MDKKNPDAFHVGQLAERLASGYFSHTAAILIAKDERAVKLVPEILKGQSVPIGSVQHKDGTEYNFDFQHFLDLGKSDSFLSEEFDRVWFIGAILMLGDALDRNQYFDRAPELELLRHIRNGIAHGNRFRIDNPLKLSNYPAHNRDAWVKSNNKTVFEIIPALDGSNVLFDFMAAGDMVDLLYSIGLYLIRMGNGDPLRPESRT